MAGSPWAPFVSQNSEWAPLGGREGPYCLPREPDFEPFSWFELPFGCQKIKVPVMTESFKTPSGPTKNACCLKCGSTKMCFLPRENDTSKNSCTSQKCIGFQNFDPLHFCTVFSTICGTVVQEIEKTQGDRNLVFGTPWPILRLRGVEISVRDTCQKNSRVLPRVVCRRCLWRV